MYVVNMKTPSDFALLEAYKKLKINNYKKYSFLKRGSDERQYNSPGGKFLSPQYLGQNMVHILNIILLWMILILLH